MPKTAEAPKRAGAKKTDKLQTEIGLTIKVLPSHRIAEDIARLREETDDRQTKIEKRLPDLLKQMKTDGLAELVARAPGGTTYLFEHVGPSEEKVKISKPKA